MGLDHEEILAWAEGQFWSQAMVKCPQDFEYHSEGDVWTHTKMVCGELVRLDEWSGLSDREQKILFYSALFHDCGKPETSIVVDGRITSPKHSAKGEVIVRSDYSGLAEDVQTREEIARLVRFHSRPVFLLDKDDPVREVIWMSWLANNKLLYLLAKADNRGRIGSRSEELLSFWKEVAEENSCYDQPFPFANDSARMHFYRGGDQHYVPYEKYRCTVTMMSGLPGSGKDTWLSKVDIPIVSLDDLREELAVEATDNQGEVIQLAQERCREHLRAGRDFAFNATNLMRSTRKRWVDLFLNYEARIEAVYIEPPLDRILEQNKRRPAKVPEDVIRKLFDKREPPTLTEVHGLKMES